MAIDKIVQWRRQFDMTCTKDAGLRMFSEEVDELMDAIALHNKVTNSDLAPTDVQNARRKVAEEGIDVLFVLVQLFEAYNINIDEALEVVLKSNYSKRMSWREYEEYREMIPKDMDVKIKLDGGATYVYLYRDGKLQKPPTFKQKTWQWTSQ